LNLLYSRLQKVLTMRSKRFFILPLLLTLAGVLFVFELNPSDAQRSEAPLQATTTNAESHRDALLAAWPKAVPPFDVQEHTLANGLRVLLVDQGEAPIVSSFLWYDVGSADEAYGETGVAHYLEHMMFKGGQKFQKGDIDRLTAKHGGTNNAFTSTDYTAYFFTFPKAVWTLALDIELDRMTTLELDSNEFNAEKKVVQEESNISFDDPADQMWEEQMREMYGEAHPYSHPVLGWPEDIANLSVTRMRAFHQKYYSPNNATLVIAGDIDPDQALAEIKQRFDAVPRSRFGVTRAGGVMPKGGSSRLVRLGDVEAAEGSILLQGVSVFDRRSVVYDVLASVLATGENSRLYQRLVKEEGLCDSVSAFHYSRRLGGTFHVSWTMQSGTSEADRDQVEAIVLEELRKLSEDAPSQIEVDRAIREREVSQIFDQASSSEVASSLGYYSSSYGDWRFMFRELEALREVKPESVRGLVSAKQLDTQRVITWLLPKKRVSSAGPEASAPEFPQLDVQEVTLPNRLRILMLPIASGPEVFTLQVDYNAGTVTQPVDKPGLIDLFDATLGAGTENMTREQIAAIFDANGGSFNAGARGISSRVLARDWEEAIDVTADVLMRANFPESEIELERTSLITSVARLNESHSSVASRAYARLLYGPEHPYGTANTRLIANVEKLTRSDLVQHYNTFIAPDNTRIIAVGKFDPSELSKAIEARLGTWQAERDAAGAEAFQAFLAQRIASEADKLRKIELAIDHAKATIDGESPEVVELVGESFDEDQIPAGANTVLIDYPSKTQCIIRMGILGVTRDNPDYYALRVLDHVLGTSPGFADRFSRILRDEMGLAYSVYANMTRTAGHEPGAWLGYIGTRPDSVPAALDGMHELVRQIREEPVGEEELSTARNYLLSTYTSDLEGSSNLASLISNMDEYDLGWDYLRVHSEKIKAVTAEDVQRVAMKYLVPERMITVIAGPLDRIPDDGGNDESDEGDDE